MELDFKEHLFSFVLVSILLFYEKNLRYEQFTTCTPFTPVGHFVLAAILKLAEFQVARDQNSVCVM